MYTTGAMTRGSNIEQSRERWQDVTGARKLAQYIPWWLEAKHSSTAIVYDHLPTITLKGDMRTEGIHLSNGRPKTHRAESAISLEPRQGSLEPWKG
jgi:hypothetical protein